MTGVMSRQQAVLNFIEQLEKNRVMIHGFLLARQGETIGEGYYAPFKKSRPHRMFSVSKSVTGLAIGLLWQDGRIGLEDKITSYFPDKLPPKVAPWMAEMTIRDMLCMATCFDKTAFNSKEDKDWVKGFFHASPVHKPGTVFSYDSSSSHVLCALVERLCQEDILCFMQKRLFTPLGMNGEKRWLKDPAGVSHGASGLVMTLGDMSLLAAFLAGDGQGLMEQAFLREATAMQIPTIQRRVPEERYGYGYQIWRTRDGFGMFGMGGQLGIVMPERKLVLCTVADTQMDAAGTQHIYDAFFAHLAYADMEMDDPQDQARLDEKLSELSCLCIEPGCEKQKDHLGVYEFEENPMDIRNVVLSEGCWRCETGGETLKVPYGTGRQALSRLREQPVMASGGWPNKNTFFMRCYWIGDTPCGFDALMCFDGAHVTMRLTRAADPLSNGMEGQCSGVLIAKKSNEV